MTLAFQSGASVSRVWRDGSGEVLAQFQYFHDAKEWAQHKFDKDPDVGAAQLVAVCHSTAKMYATPTKEPK